MSERGFPQDLGPYADLSDDELDKILKGQAPDPGEAARKRHAEKLGQEYKEPETLPDPAEKKEADEDVDDEPDAEGEADVDDEDADEDSEEEEDDSDPEPEKAEEKSPADRLEERLALLEKRLQLEELRRQKSDAARERAELLASKHAGRAGYYKQQVEKAAPAKPAAKADDADPFEDGDEKSAAPERQEQQAPASDPTWDDARAELVTMAINDEGVKYSAQIEPELDSIPEATREEFKTRLAELVQEEAVPYKEVFQTSSLKAVRKLARSIMQSAYATARIEWMDKMTEAASERQAESAEKSRRRKKKAAISKSGAAPKRKRRRAKSYEEMSDAELEAEFAKEFGANYKQSRDSLS